MDGDKIWHTNDILHINPNWGDLEGLSFVVQFSFSSLGLIVARGSYNQKSKSSLISCFCSRVYGESIFQMSSFLRIPHTKCII